MGYNYTKRRDFWTCEKQMQKAANATRKAQRQNNNRRVSTHLETARIHLAMAIRIRENI